jgi:BCD family chlorophyll transporter-like MFS transporter
MSASLRVSQVVVKAGSTRLLDGVSFEAPPGRIIAIVGPNGAGKTTLLDAISGVAPNMAGVVTVNGDAGSNGSHRAGIGRVFQGSPLPETLTVAEVAALVAGSRPAATELLGRFGLTPHASSFVSELSTGMRRILDLAIATIGQPSVLLLDEPASGLAQSEIEYLAELIRRWRDATSAAVIIVEHDAWLVRNLAEEVIFLDGGRIVAQGAPGEVLRPPARSGPRMQSPADERFRSALSKVAADAAPAMPLPKRTISKWTLLRLGLRELSAGMASVLILGVLSRVLRVELGVTLGVVTAILASYNLAAPIAVAVGHRSDTRPLFGKRRTPYIVGGAVITGLAVAAAPHVAGRLAGGVSIADVVLSVLLFVAMGFGMYSAGTVFFALLADLSGPSERGHTASVVYLELMIGVLFGVGLTGAILKSDAKNIGTLFGVAGLLVVVLSVIAVWGQEKKLPPAEAADPARPAPPRPKLRAAVREIAAIPMARTFFAFMVLSTLFLFLQQAVLTSFGGDVLHLSVRATSGFSAILTIGTIAGMTIAGRPFAEQIGHRKVALVGLGCSVVAFGGLAAAAAARAAPPAWLSILAIGFTSGLFNVSSLALMMGMADRRRTALFMGTWTLAHALADGAATAGGGSLFEIFHHLLGSVPGGYAAVFAIEAAGLAACMPLLRAVDPSRFATEAAGPGDLALAEAAAAAAVDPIALEVLAAPPQDPPTAKAGPTSPARKPARPAGAKTAGAKTAGAKTAGAKTAAAAKKPGPRARAATRANAKSS